MLFQIFSLLPLCCFTLLHMLQKQIDRQLELITVDWYYCIRRICIFECKLALLVALKGESIWKGSGGGDVDQKSLVCASNTVRWVQSHSTNSLMSVLGLKTILSLCNIILQPWFKTILRPLIQNTESLHSRTKAQSLVLFTKFLIFLHFRFHYHFPLNRGIHRVLYAFVRFALACWHHMWNMWCWAY